MSKNHKTVIDRFTEVIEFTLSNPKTNNNDHKQVQTLSDQIKNNSFIRNKTSVNTPGHKNTNFINIVPKTQYNSKNIEKWCKKYKDDIDYIFNEIISIFYKYEIDFFESDATIYEHFKKFLFKFNMCNFIPKDNIYNKLDFNNFDKDTIYNTCYINTEFDEFFGPDYSNEIYNLYNELIKSVEIVDTLSPYRLEKFFMGFVDKQANLYYSESEYSSDGQFSDEENI